MCANSEQKKASGALDKVKWLVVFALIVLMVWGNIYFSEPNTIFQANLIIRVVALVVLAALTLAIAAMTNKGHSIMTFARESRTELRKVVWPSRKEAMHTTLIIAVITIIASLFLWGLDSLMIRIISFITMLGH